MGALSAGSTLFERLPKHFGRRQKQTTFVVVCALRGNMTSLYIVRVLQLKHPRFESRTILVTSICFCVLMHILEPQGVNSVTVRGDSL